MLLNGVNHVAILTNDSERLHAFYREVFDATVSRAFDAGPGTKLSFVDIGPGNELNVFEIEGNDEAQRQTPMFGRGRIDHIGLQASSLDAFHTIRDRLIARRPPTDSSPTSGRSSASSSSVLTGSRARCASRTPTRSPASSTRPARPRPATSA